MSKKLKKKEKTITEKKLLEFIQSSQGDFDMFIWLLNGYFSERKNND